jgi:hypothetical protein
MYTPAWPEASIQHRPQTIDERTLLPTIGWPVRPGRWSQSPNPQRTSV